MRIRALKSLPDLGHENSDLTFGDRNALLVAVDAFQGNRGEDDEDFPSGLLNAFGESLRPLRCVPTFYPGARGLTIRASACHSRK